RHALLRGGHPAGGHQRRLRAELAGARRHGRPRHRARPRAAEPVAGRRRGRDARRRRRALRPL
ncbi:MAG: hypothetical protein AVDCRST_MAG30-936, partial [uncultured Solirubrobacteraceae bacterium]